MIYLREEEIPLVCFLGEIVMNRESFDYQIYRLSDKFYDDYSSVKYPELLKKNTRPYSCLLIKQRVIILYAYHIVQKSIISMLINSKILSARGNIVRDWIIRK